MARPLAERGFQVLVQSTRGTFGSGGVFDPMRCEREDGLATLEWLVKQPWAGGSIVLLGPSYLGYAQWAVADRLPPEVKAMIPHVTESALTLEFLRHDGLSLETPFGWGVMVAGQERRGAMLRGIARGRLTRRALDTLPLARADIAALGHHSDYVQDILAHDADDPRWAGIDHRHRVAGVSVPVSSIGGWYDIFLPGQVRDFTVLQEAGRPARLTIGPWSHASVEGAPLREAIEFGLAHARGQQPPPRPPVRLFVMGEEAWRDFESWPPPGYPPRRFHLQPGTGLAAEPPGESVPDRYRYDPADPTPAAGGARLAAGPGGWTTRPWRPARTCSATPLPRSPGMPRSSARSARRSGSGPACATPTCSCGCATWTRGAARATCVTAWSACPAPTRSPGPPSGSGRPRTGSRPATASGSRCPAAPSRASRAIPAPVSRTPPPPPCAPPTRPSTTTRTAPRPSCCRSGTSPPPPVTVRVPARFPAPASAG